MKKLKLWQKNLILGLIAVVVVVVPLMVLTNTEFGGADGAAMDLVGEINADYKPWAEPLISPPGSETESLLFALQAAIGAGIVGFGFGRLSAKVKGKQDDTNR